MTYRTMSTDEILTMLTYQSILIMLFGGLIGNAPLVIIGTFSVMLFGMIEVHSMFTEELKRGGGLDNYG